MKDEACEELDRIAIRNGGVLRPLDVVNAARNPKSALHSRFTWDNDEAAHAHRLWEARQLITLYITHEPRLNREVQVYVSLPSDQANKHGGYRRLTDVLSDEEHRAELLAQALAELTALKQKYKDLTELARIWDAVEKVKAA